MKTTRSPQMKLSFLVFAFSVLSALSTVALADESDMHHGSVNCLGQKGVLSVSLELSVFSSSGNTAHFSYTDLTHATEPWVFDVNPKDIFMAEIGYQSVAFEEGHHNTIIKLLGDADIFGSSSDDATEKSPYKGVLYLQTGNGENPTKEKFEVTCTKVL